MAKDGSSQTWLIVAIAIIAIAVILFLWWQKKEAEKPPEMPPEDYIPGDEEGDTDPYTEPGYRTLKYDHTTHDRQSITWWLPGNYYATLLSGTFRVGGGIFTNVRISIEHDGKWKHIATEGAWPGGLKQFSVTPNVNISAVKWEAEQGWFSERFVDEVHAQLMVEA